MYSRIMGRRKTKTSVPKSSRVSSSGASRAESTLASFSSGEHASAMNQFELVKLSILLDLVESPESNHIVSLEVVSCVITHVIRSTKLPAFLDTYIFS